MNVASGKSHIGLITEEGELFMIGNNDYGQLGGGQNKSRQTQYPVRLESLINKGLIIDQVACGFSHTLIVTSTGRIFSWGCGTQGQLGQGNIDSQATPSEIEYFRGRYQAASEIISIQCGANHSGMLDQSGKLYMWGAGEVGQLGTGNRMDELQPKHIQPHLQNGEVVINFSLGYFHSLILTSSNRCLQTGLPNDSPATIFSSIPCLDGYEITKIKAAHTSYVLNSQQHLIHFQTPYSLTKLDNLIVEDFEVGQDQSIIRDKDNKFYYYFPLTKKLEHLTEINGKPVSSLTILSCGPSFILGVKNRSSTQSKQRNHKSQHKNSQQQLIRHHRHSSSMDKIGNYQARYEMRQQEQQVKEVEQIEESEKSRGQSTQVRKMSESHSQYTMMPKSIINSNNKPIQQNKTTNLYPISDEKLLKRRRKIEFEDSSNHYGSPDKGFQQRSQCIEYQNSIMHQDSLRQQQTADENYGKDKTDKRKLKEALKQEIHLRIALEKQLMQLQREFDLFRDEVGVDQMRKLLNDSQSEYQKLYEVCVKECEKATKYLELYKKEKHMREERESQIMELGLSEEMLRNQIKHVDSQLSQLRDQHQQEQKSLQLTIVELQKALDTKEEDKQRLKEKIFDLEETSKEIRSEVKQVEDHYKGLIMIEKQNQQILSSQVKDLKTQVNEQQEQIMQQINEIKINQDDIRRNKRNYEDSQEEIENLKQMIQLKCQNLREYDQTFVRLNQSEKENIQVIENLKEQIKNLTYQQKQEAPEMQNLQIIQQAVDSISTNQKQILNRSNSSASVSIKKQTISTARTDVSSMKSIQKTNAKSPNFQAKKVQSKAQTSQISQRQQAQKKPSEHSPEKLSKILQYQENQATSFLKDVVQIAKCNISPKTSNPLVESQNNQVQSKQQQSLQQQQRKNSRSSSPIDYLGLKPKLNIYAPTKISQQHKQNLSRNFNDIPSPRILNTNKINEDALATPSQYSLTITPTVQNEQKSGQNVPYVNEFNTQSMFDLEDNQFCSRGSSFNHLASSISRSFDGASYQQKSKKSVKFIVDSQHTLETNQFLDNTLNPEASKKPSEEEEIEKLYESLATDMKSLKSCNTSNGNVSSGSQSNISTLKDKLETIRRNKLLLEDKIKEYEKKLAK